LSRKPLGDGPTASLTAQERPTLELVSSESAFAELGSGWDDLVLAMPRPSPFLLHAWLLEWYRHYGRGSELAVHAAFRDGGLVAALPLVRTRWRGLRVSRFLGGQQSSLADLLLDPVEPEATGATLIGDACATHDFAELFGLGAGSRIAGIAGVDELHLFRRADGPVLDLTDDWEALYEAKVSAKRRSNYRRRLRQLEGQGKVEFGSARTPTELEALLPDVFRLHTLRWAGLADGSGIATARGVEFHRAALAALADKGFVRLSTMTFEGGVIAFALAFALAGRLYGYRTAFDPSFARYSPGLLTVHALLASACREGLQRVELLGAADTFKVELADRLEPIHVGIGLAGSAQGRTVVAARTSFCQLREGLKRSPAARAAYDRARPLLARVARTKNVLKA
jgi:CelD/BcsL family acetyltransferase involved in cellulose biosynthesis